MEVVGKGLQVKPQNLKSPNAYQITERKGERNGIVSTGPYSDEKQPLFFLFSLFLSDNAFLQIEFIMLMVFTTLRLDPD